MVTMDIRVLVSMMNNSGKVPVPGTRMALVPVAMSAPPAVLIVPPMPEAEPAKWGRTDIMPDVALGKTIPLPRPIKQTQPKKVMGRGVVNRNSTIHSRRPVVVAKVPVRIILLTPSAVENRPDSPLPKI